jgi:hypothetical protein
MYLILLSNISGYGLLFLWSLPECKDKKTVFINGTNVMMLLSRTLASMASMDKFSPLLLMLTLSVQYLILLTLTHGQGVI